MASDMWAIADQGKRWDADRIVVLRDQYERPRVAVSPVLLTYC